MSTTDDRTDRLQRALASVYGGPLEDFVRRREALAKELRSAGERESAAAVKRLRKPSRTAWALNLGALNGHEAAEALADAVAETIEAQAGGGDVRAAIAGLRAAVREFAGKAALAAEEAGQRVDPGTLTNAVLAVLGKEESFEQLRAGYLTEIPEAGGLDFLAALPMPTVPVSARARARAASAAPSRAKHPADEAAAAASRQAGRALEQARLRSEAARAAVRDAESMLATAEERVRRAEQEARAARDDYERARVHVDAAADRLRKAESAVADAERQVERA